MVLRHFGCVFTVLLSPRTLDLEKMLGVGLELWWKPACRRSPKRSWLKRHFADDRYHDFFCVIVLVEVPHARMRELGGFRFCVK
jgi:hypothetical protein